jgi:hypothetical protein
VRGEPRSSIGPDKSAVTFDVVVNYNVSAREDVFRSDSLLKGATRHCLTSWLMLDIDV